VRYRVPSNFNWSLPTALISKDNLTAVVTKGEIVPMAFVVTRMLHKVYRLRTFPILFNKKDANVVIACRFIVVDTGGRINRLYVCVEPAGKAC
jgi:hypothetical protein